MEPTTIGVLYAICAVVALLVWQGLEYWLAVKKPGNLKRRSGDE